MSYRSFRDVDGNNISFENAYELELSKQTDVVTGEITAYLVENNGHLYEVSQQTFEALEALPA